MPTVMITGATNPRIGLAPARHSDGEGWRFMATSRDPVKADALRAIDPEIAVHTLAVTGFAVDR